MDDPRARSGESLAAQLRDLGVAEVHAAGDVGGALTLAHVTRTAPGGRIVVCGSFRVVGPALQWLGLY